MRALYHLTLATGHARLSLRSEVSDDTVKALTPLARRGDGNLPPPLNIYTVKITRERDAAAFTLAHPEYGPLVTCMLCQDSEQSAYCWKSLTTIYLQETETILRSGTPLPDKLMQMPPCPEHYPWLAVNLHPNAYLMTGTMRWAGDWERCMAWAIIDDNT